MCVLESGQVYVKLKKKILISSSSRPVKIEATKERNQTKIKKTQKKKKKKKKKKRRSTLAVCVKIFKCPRVPLKIAIQCTCMFSVIFYPNVRLMWLRVYWLAKYICSLAHCSSNLLTRLYSHEQVFCQMWHAVQLSLALSWDIMTANL